MRAYRWSAVILSGVLAIVTWAASSSAAPAADEDALQAVANKIVAEINGKTDGFTSVYAPSFLTRAPEDQVKEMFRVMHGENGDVIRILERSHESDSRGLFEFDFHDGVMQVSLAIEPGGQHLVTNLLFGRVEARLKSMKDVEDALAKLPGEVSFQVVRLDDGKVLGELNADQPLAIGSAFKLYLLAALEDQQVAWDRVVKVEEKFKSLPIGDLRTWPDGSAVTVDTLAIKMISQSDNTAADHLLALLGRENVEAILAKAGMAKPSLNVPFLSTREAFELKVDSGLRGDYLAADLTGKRKILERIANDGTEWAEAADFSKPVAIDQIQWFGSAADVCRVMGWLDRKNDSTALGILAVTPGLALAPGFEYVGYKGGSEAGLLNMSWLLHSRSGKHYALSGSWNDSKEEVNMTKFAGLMLAATDLIENANGAAGTQP